VTQTLSGPELGELLAEIQSRGVRVEDTIQARSGGAGPSDAGMIRVEGVAITFPFTADYVAESPYVLRPDGDDGGWAVYREGRRLAGAEVPPRPKFYDLTTPDGIPYWKIALLHIDSLASTVIQTCIYWGKDDQCQFCGIELSLEAGRTIPVKKPEHLAAVAVAAKELDGAVDVTLTSGTTRGADKGARYLGRCAKAIKASSGLPVQAQFEPPDDLSVLEEIKEQGVDSVGMHVESFDPSVLASVAPAKARTGVEGYFRAWERAVEVFGRGQVSTYVILGMGEDPGLTVDGCKRAIDAGVYPFVVPLRPVPGSLMGDLIPPPAEYVESVYREVAPYLAVNGLASWEVHAGCARCGACSALAAYERHDAQPASGRQLPILQVHEAGGR
jgi:radical SAM protein (TIGR04043 family)